ncbi:HAD-like domain-containing protein [Xylariaceae sp. FL1019]|nr:HAD-like domain-containing protein [Xylariaceae sp. FL1019]
MGSPESFFPAVRACIFDLDGLLLNTEDIVTHCLNNILTKYGRPTIPRSIRAQLMGIPKSSDGDVFHDWAKLPISREQFSRELTEEVRTHYPECKAMPGALELLSKLSYAHSTATGEKIAVALASSSESHAYESKTSRPEAKQLMSMIPSNRRILGDDPRIREGRNKPAPDVYLVALQALDSTMNAGEKPIMPNECLVFEDSVIGVEAGRRAGMRVIWVPHPEMAVEYQSQLKEVLAGRIGLVKIGEEGQLGEMDDGWAESIPGLEHFDCEKYGIRVSN